MEKDIEDELWELALNTPSKHYYMHITDTKTGIVSTVDQSLDTHIPGTPEMMDRLVKVAGNVWNYFMVQVDFDKIMCDNSIEKPTFKNAAEEEMFKTRLSYMHFFKGKPDIKELTLNDFKITFEGTSGLTAYVLMLRFFESFIMMLDRQGKIKWGTQTERTG